MTQWDKDPALSLMWLGLLLWHGFTPWPMNFCVPWVRLKTNKQTNNNSCLDVLSNVKAYIQCLDVWQDIPKLLEGAHTGRTFVASSSPRR